MTRHPTARRVHRDSTAPDDVFVAGVLESTAWAKQHSRKLIIGGIAAAVTILLLVLFFTNRASRREAALAQLSQTRAVALSGNPQLAIRDLEQFLVNYGGTPAAAEARLMLGRSYLEVGQPQRTIETVSSQAGDLDTDVGVNAAFLLAAAHEASQQPQLAEEVYLRIAEDARFLFQQQDGLDNAARLRMQNGNAAGAAELYERLLELTPDNTAEQQIFELRLGEARAMAVNGGAAAGTGAAAPAVDAPAAGTTPTADSAAAAGTPPPATTGG